MARGNRWDRCTDCNCRLGSPHYIEVGHPGVTVCERCVIGRREQDGPDSWWWGLEWQREVPAVTPILMGAYCIGLCIITLVLLFRMHTS